MAKPNVNEIMLTDGASQAVSLLIQCLITSPRDAVMIPTPQYPLYSASITLNGGTQAPYYLDEDLGWQLDVR